MIVERYSGLKTLKLFQCYTTTWEEFENVVNTKKKRFYTKSRFQKWKGQRIAELGSRLNVIEAEIASRYEWLIKLFCRQAGITDERQYKATVDAVWNSVRDTWAEEMAFMPRDHREFPRSLWGACERNIKGNISSLKGRFMLRPFVDDLPGEEERTALLTRVYGSRGKIPTAREDFERLLEPACLQLHHQLLQRGASLSVLTDDVLSPETLEGVTARLEFYVNLLFPRAADPTKGE